MMEKSPWNGLWANAAAAVAFGFATVAQTTGGSLQGKVVDQGGRAVPGVVIQVSGPSLQEFVGAATDASGSYLVPFLPAGSGYSVKAEAQGYATVLREGITIPLNTRVDLLFTMSAGSTEIVVTAAAPLVDHRSAQSGLTLSSSMIQLLPLQRDSSQLAFLAPTVVDSGPSPPGMVSIGGATGGENIYLVEGMDVTDTVFGTGPVARLQEVAGGPIGNMLNFDFIRDYQVMDGGVPPEYGGAMGGTLNAITRSGGNEYHGSLFAYYWSDSLQAKSTVYPCAPTIIGNAGYTRYDVGANLGGYIVKDKLWFYVGYDYNRMKQYTQVPSDPAYGDHYLYLDGRPAQSGFAGQQITDASEVNQQYAFKLAWNASPAWPRTASAQESQGESRPRQESRPHRRPWGGRSTRSSRHAAGAICGSQDSPCRFCGL